MKKIIFLIPLLAILIIVTSCDKGFDELNTSKTGSLTLDPAFILNNSIIASSPGTTLVYDLAIVQHIITSNSGVNAGGNFNQTNIGSTPATWTNYYQNVIRYSTNVIDRTKSDASRSNLYNMARIIRANAFMVLTDTYGDIPYADTGSGKVFLPKYERQETVYNNVISELTEATGALDPNGRIESSDVLYSGVIAKWKKFGYSLLLRAGMRLSKINPTKAQQVASAAFAAGVILLNDDNAIIKHDANYVNSVGNSLNSTEGANFYLASTFVDALKSTNDPRLSAIAVRYVGATSGQGQTTAAANRNSADQVGMPIGSDDATAQSAAVSLGIGSRYAFSQADRNRVVKPSSPMFIVSAAQTNLLLAEAAARGWITGGNSAASTYYTNAIKAHMDQMALYDATSAISSTARDTYANANALDVSTLDASLRNINYQYWIASFLNGSETWANLRRSGYPVLPANPFPGKEVSVIRRLTYPPSETVVNGTNVQEAINAMGGNALDTRVWWDKP